MHVHQHRHFIINLPHVRPSPRFFHPRTAQLEIGPSGQKLPQNPNAALGRAGFRTPLRGAQHGVRARTSLTRIKVVTEHDIVTTSCTPVESVRNAALGHPARRSWPRWPQHAVQILWKFLGRWAYFRLGCTRFDKSRQGSYIGEISIKKTN